MNHRLSLCTLHKYSKILTVLIWYVNTVIPKLYVNNSNYCAFSSLPKIHQKQQAQQKALLASNLVMTVICQEREGLYSTPCFTLRGSWSLEMTKANKMVGTLLPLPPRQSETVSYLLVFPHRPSRINVGLSPRYSSNNWLGSASGNLKIHICSDCCPVFWLNALTTDTLVRKSFARYICALRKAQVSRVDTDLFR